MRRPRLLVLYDGRCGFCRRAIAVLKTFDVLNDLEPMIGPSDDPHRQRHPAITDDMLAHDLYVVDREKIAGGYEAYQVIARRLLLLWPLAPIMRWPPIAAVGRRVYRRIADSRSRALRPVSEPAVVRTAALRAVPLVGWSLVLLQAGTSMLLVTVSSARPYLPPDSAVRRGLDAVARRQPRWPFDQYPAFAAIWKPEVELWEARLLLTPARETRISARAHAAALGHSAKAWHTTQRMRREQDPERHRDRSLALARALWRHESHDLRRDAREVRVYHVKYDMDPGARRIVKEQLIHTFPASTMPGPPQVRF